ncbi:MAG: hypothetical protein B6D44_12700 [Ignavibacteriales bacterium UTCHB2]|jgi:hypothetical protein|nr:MAG: hypothetical protein BWY38_01359 [Ignavibacteria bacterium ADurb.Bin266]OQY71466.1 MAG: hypothetical protein B6D44_12700 [Ignavibacteriales bacterium UTCHB2]HQI40239.1 hypothetical protein [Ignavibacteriaceae bacterium]
MKEITLSKNFLDEVEQFADKKLLKKNDITILLENYFKNRNIKEFEDFVFVGKYINGLFNVLQSANSISDFQNLEQVKKDLNDNLEKITSLLKEISLSANDKQKTTIKNDYLNTTTKSFHNIKQLVEDLDLIKKYINFLKRK